MTGNGSKRLGGCDTGCASVQMCENEKSRDRVLPLADAWHVDLSTDSTHPLFASRESLPDDRQEALEAFAEFDVFSMPRIAPGLLYAAGRGLEDDPDGDGFVSPHFGEDAREAVSKLLQFAGVSYAHAESAVYLLALTQRTDLSKREVCRMLGWDKARGTRAEKRAADYFAGLDGLVSNKRGKTLGQRKRRAKERRKAAREKGQVDQGCSVQREVVDALVYVIFRYTFPNLSRTSIMRCLCWTPERTRKADRRSDRYFKVFSFATLHVDGFRRPPPGGSSERQSSRGLVRAPGKNVKAGVKSVSQLTFEDWYAEKG